METQNIISINNLVKDFPVGNGYFRALNKVNLQFNKGEFAGLVGPSGSGKTTLLNIIGTLDAPTKGEVNVMGLQVDKLSIREAAELRKSGLGFVFQSYNLLPVYTVFENIELPLLLLKIAESERNRMVKDALEWVGLTSKLKSKPNMLSGGECQRVAIARAMVKRPSIVLADEPTANLDAENSHHILQTMQKLNQELHTTFIFATHDDKVISYLKRQISISDGKTVKDEFTCFQR